ncbi:hypothetical protein [Glycomyces terrestris]|uniref:hypothetical protein n=1 Tax=Glycomyces terrestris TaxID=2493553 RepID=UPI0013159EFB|nr:hypothetical protein [Glycomyces terrestris]
MGGLRRRPRRGRRRLTEAHRRALTAVLALGDAGMRRQTAREAADALRELEAAQANA